MRLLKREELLQLDKDTRVEIILPLQEQVQALTQRVEALESRLNGQSQQQSTAFHRGFSQATRQAQKPA